MKILAIETSFDETAAAVVENGTHIVSNVLSSSAALHKKYGGTVPEVAAREQLKYIIPILREALLPVPLASIDAIAVTVGPGLIGSLLVGVETAKTIAMVSEKPIIPVNHVVAHMYANFLEGNTVRFPAISLVVSGGHTELYLMTSEKNIQWLGGTYDDAAGEAFDKTARLLGFENKGGPAVAAAAATYTAPRKASLHFPRPMMDDSFNFSFSGLKTAVLREWKKQTTPDVPAFAYEVQEAITDVLAAKTLRAAHQYNAKSILLSGGVAANLRLREKLPDAIVPPPPLCTDNAVYIASCAYFRGEALPWKDIEAVPDLSVEVQS